MALYSEKVMDHFRNPRNVGVIEDANGIGEVGNAKCGDIMKMYLKIEDDIVQDVKFETFGCGSAIASSSMATELIKGQPVSAGGLSEPDRKKHLTFPCGSIIMRLSRFFTVCTKPVMICFGRDSRHLKRGIFSGGSSWQTFIKEHWD